MECFECDMADKNLTRVGFGIRNILYVSVCGSEIPIATVGRLNAMKAINYVGGKPDPLWKIRLRYESGTKYAQSTIDILLSY